MKKAIIIVGIIILLAVVFLLWFFSSDASNPYSDTAFLPNVKSCDYSVPADEIPTFREVNIEFNHTFDSEKSLPLMAACLIDIDNDGVDEIFYGGGNGQSDQLFSFDDGGFSDITESAILENQKTTNSLGAVSFDIDNNGWVDLLVTRKEGVFLLTNEGGKFTSQRLNIEVDEKSNPATITLGDFNRDGLVDIFLSAYLKKEKMEGQTIFNQEGYGGNSLLLMNKGSLEFEDVTSSMGMSYTHNTFQGIFTDIDNDGWIDLVVAYDTGEARIYKNNRGEKFTNMPSPMSGKYGYPMGIALGDFNSDGYVDFFFSNTGSSIPATLVKGDLRDDQELILDWMMWKNNGDFTFSDVAKKTKVADFEFSWGALFEDFNLDGKQDLVVAENYIDFPPQKLFKLPGRFMVQRPDGTFAAVEDQAGVINKNYGIAPLASDFNNDGYPDLAFSNLNGPARVLINNGGSKNYLKIRFSEVAKNAGARVTATLKSGKILSDHYVIGEGLSSDMTSVITFGLGTEERLESITINYTDGTSESHTNLDDRSTIIVGSRM